MTDPATPATPATQPFGNITEDSAYRGRYGFTGREFDVETGLQYNRARYYDPSTGRWISQDPLGFDAGDSNLYRYVSNKSISASDPSGNWFWVRDPVDALPVYLGLFSKRGLSPVTFHFDGKLFFIFPQDQYKALADATDLVLQKDVEMEKVFRSVGIGEADGYWHKGKYHSYFGQYPEQKKKTKSVIPANNLEEGLDRHTEQAIREFRINMELDRNPGKNVWIFTHNALVGPANFQGVFVLYGPDRKPKSRFQAVCSFDPALLYNMAETCLPPGWEVLLKKK